VWHRPQTAAKTYASKNIKALRVNGVTKDRPALAKVYHTDSAAD
jgi:hypothetical protein